jgi:hypothetical protein
VGRLRVSRWRLEKDSGARNYGTLSSGWATARSHAAIVASWKRYFLSSALWMAAELDVAGWLIQGPKTGAELARATNTHADILTRVLRCLTVAGVFAESVPGTFALTPAAELLRKDVPGSQRDMGDLAVRSVPPSAFC